MTLTADDLTATEYHALPSLSASGAKLLLPPSCPAKFKWQRDHPRPPKDAYDFGHAAHRFVLGKGEELARIDFPDRRTKAAKEEIAAAREAGLVPLLAKDYDTTAAMAKALRDDPAVSKVFTDGEAEVSKFWTDKATGVELRARFDWLPTVHQNRQLIVPDYKTAESADPGKFTRAAFDYGYHIQAAAYLEAIEALEIADDPRFVFVVQEKTPPYLVTLIELDPLALDIGRHQWRKAIDIYARCMETDTWPGYADDIVTVSAPVWVENHYFDDIAPDEIEV